MASRLRAFDWPSTPSGPARDWPAGLKTMVRLLLSTSNPMCVFWGRELVQLYNDAFAATFGTGGGPNALGISAFDDAAPLGASVASTAAQLLDGSSAGWREERRVRQDRWTCEFTPIEDEDGVHGVLVMCNESARKDLTVEKVSSEKWRRLHEAILSNTPDLIYVFDLDHRFAYANQVLLDMWGKTFEEAIGKNCLELGYEPWHAEMHDREIERVRRTRLPIRGEAPFDGAFGRRDYDYIFVPVLGPTGEVEAVAGTTRDITERKQAENALLEASERKDEFVAMLAHELRNPLAPTATASALLDMPKLDDARRRQIGGIIGRQTRHLTGLVDDLLDVSRVTRGLVKLDEKVVELAGVVAEAIEQTAPLIQARAHQLEVVGLLDGAFVSGDRTRLVQVVANLLNNAAKYTPAGGRICVESGIESGQASIRIRDNGIGMAPSLVESAFELFVQAERAPDRSQGGLGIGLALVKRLIELHRGHVTAFSEGIGKGSCFTIFLPLVAHALARSTADEPAGAQDGGALKVMIVDDNIDGANTLALYVQALGHRAIVEYAPAAALVRARAEKPDVFLLDIGLPEMNGNEPAHSNAQDLPDSKNATFFALSGYPEQSDQKKMMANFDHYFVKPVDPGHVAALLSKIAG
jgi:PAS domain S-box-containing protein